VKALPANRGQQGFTIVEALVAFVILAVLGTALFAVFGQSARHAREVALREQAALVARSVLERIGPREIAVLGPRESEEAGGLRARVTVTAVPDTPPNALQELRLVEIDILGPVAAPLLHVTTYRLYSRLSRGEP